MKRTSDNYYQLVLLLQKKYAGKFAGRTAAT